MHAIELCSRLSEVLVDEDWNSLARGVPFRQTSWLGPWWESFGEGREACVVVARDESGKPRGLLPLYRRGTAAPQRTLGMIGDGDACSDYVSVLAQASEAEAIAFEMGRFLAEISRDPDAGWDVLEIDGVVEGDQPMAQLTRGLRQAGVTVHAQSRLHTWFAPCAASWDDYLSNLGKSSRPKMRRLLRQLNDTAGLKVHVADNCQAVHQSLDELIDLHQRRWTAVGEPGSFTTPQFRQFVRETALRFFRQDQLYLVTLRHNGQPVFGGMYLRGHDNRLYCYSTGADTSNQEIEPGNIMNAFVLKYAHDAGMEGLDLLRGDEIYKERLRASATRLVQLRCVAPAWLPRLRHAAWSTGFELKQFARRRIGRKPIEVVDLVRPVEQPVAEVAEIPGP